MERKATERSAVIAVLVWSRASLPHTKEDGISDQLSWVRAAPIPPRQNRNMRNPKRLKEGQQTTRSQLSAAPKILHAFDQYMVFKMELMYEISKASSAKSHEDNFQACLTVYFRNALCKTPLVSSFPRSSAEKIFLDRQRSARYRGELRTWRRGYESQMGF